MNGMIFGITLVVCFIVVCILYEVSKESTEDMSEYAVHPKYTRESRPSREGDLPDSVGSSLPVSRSGYATPTFTPLTPWQTQQPGGHASRLLNVASLPATPGGSAAHLVAPASAGALGTPARAAHTGIPALPMPICSELILSVKARFKLPLGPIDHLIQGMPSTAPIPVFADTHTAGNRVWLYARIQKDSGTITLLADHEGQPLLGMLKTASKGSMTIWDKNGILVYEMKSTGEQFAYSLLRGSVEVATIRFKRDQGSPGQVFIVSKLNESQVANAFRFTAIDPATKREDEFLGVRVEAGIDPVLVLLCLLGALTSLS